MLTCGIATLAFGADGLNKVTKEGQRHIQEGKTAQNKVISLIDTTLYIVSDYKIVTKIVDGLKGYNDLLQLQIDNQHKEAATIQQSMKMLVHWGVMRSP